MNEVERLIQVLETTKDSNERAKAVKQLGKLGKSAVPPLLALLIRCPSNIREYIVRTFGEIGPDAIEAVPTLINLIKDSDEYIRAQSIYSLVLIGPGAKSAIPAIKEALNTEYPEATIIRDQRPRVAFALEKIVGKQLAEEVCGPMKTGKGCGCMLLLLFFAGLGAIV